MATSSWVEKCWKDFTGESKIEEAENLYQTIKRRFEYHARNYEKEVNALTEKINNHVNSINRSKIYIRTELFPQYAEKMSLFADVTVSEDFLKECFEGAKIKITGVRCHSDLFLIDFKKDPFKANALAVISLGFATRKRAKETLLKITEEEARVNEEIERMKTEQGRLQAIEAAISDIDDYYSDLSSIYVILLNRVGHSLNYLLSRCLSKFKKISENTLSVKLLPKSQLKELYAMNQITQILKGMMDTQITVDAERCNVSTAYLLLKGSYTDIHQQFDLS